MPGTSVSYSWPDYFWPHQSRGCDQTVAAINDGIRRIVYTGPCGTGKSKSMCALLEWASSEMWSSALYTHRRLLLHQISGVLTGHGIDHGIRAAGHAPALLRDVQLCMTQSERSAVYTRKSRALHNAHLVLPDELHAQGGNTLPTILRDHYNNGAAIVGFTATPLDLMGEWDHMVIAGTPSEGRACGALVPAYTFCPDAPKLQHIKSYRIGEDLTDKENHRAIMRPGVFGRVHSHWKRLNPKGLPTILFAPDVAGSIFFAEEFWKAGVRSAHIDAKQIWLDGEYLQSTDDDRAAILRMFQDGEIAVLTNRFVLREGIDLPCVGHCIMACVFGSLKTYLQAGGRTVRAHPSLDHVVIQDHGGNYIRHGSLNEDREWRLGMSGYKETGIRQENMRDNPDTEPIICPNCGMGRLSGAKCPYCGHVCYKRSRIVVQINGDLQLAEGPSFKPHRIKRYDNTAELWERMYYRARSKKWNATFLQAEACFFLENHYWPPRDMKFMPTEQADRFERVADVPVERLR